jgi:exonuclease III
MGASSESKDPKKTKKQTNTKMLRINRNQRSDRPAAPRDQLQGLNPEAGNEERHQNLAVEFLNRENEWNQGNRPRGRLLRENVDDITRYCIWGDSSTAVVFWERVSDCCRGSLVLAQVVKAVRVQQENGSIRFDVYVRKEYAQTLWDKLQAGTGKYGWHFREHIPYGERVGQGGRAAPRRAPNGGFLPGGPVGIGLNQELPLPSSLKVGTYNINGVRTKRRELAAFLGIVKWDVVGLQETLMRATDWQLYLRGYSLLSAMGERTESKRGLSVAVSTRYSCNMVGRTSPYWLFVRVYGSKLRQPFIFGTVYVPHRLERRRVLEGLPATMLTIQQEFPNDPIILTGDFNMTIHRLQARITTWPVRPIVLPNEGDKPTRRRANGRAVDHICYIGNTGGPVPRSKVLTDWDYSDHFPVEADLSGLCGINREEEIDPVAPPRRPRIVLPTKQTKMAKQKIASSNYWAILDGEFDEFIDNTDEQSPESVAETMNNLAGRFRDTCHEVAKEQELYPEENNGKGGMKHSIVRAVNQNRKAFTNVENASRDADPALPQLTEVYEKTKKRARLLLRKQVKKDWAKRVHGAHVNMTNTPREFWRWAAPTAGWKSKGAAQGIQPIYAHQLGIAEGDQRVLLTSFADILDAWSQHYGHLGSDVTGHSQDDTHWAHIDQHPQVPELVELNNILEQEHIWSALKVMKNHKSPGDDGIPTDFLKACLLEQPDPNPPSRKDANGEPIEYEPPPTHMTDCLLKMANFAFEHGMVAAIWAVSEVVSIPKKGDLADMNNYRGIALMTTALKVVAVILSKRMNRGLETANFFHPAQAGFRALEECVTQVAAVVEACQRRRLDGTATFLTFIDLKKAYDTVPHGALFAKLSRAGVRGKCLAFIRGLYTDNALKVRVGNGKNARLSPSAALLRGLRQG